MKTKTALKILILSLLFFAALDGICQTKYRNIPIVSSDPFLIEIWSYNTTTEKWDWYDITETELEHQKGWYFNREINIEVMQFEVLYFRFITGNEKLNCREITLLTLHGGQDKNKVKDTEDLRVRFVLDGGNHVMGNVIDKPNN